jgi:hypothetical protein
MIQEDCKIFESSDYILFTLSGSESTTMLSTLWILSKKKEWGESGREETRKESRSYLHKDCLKDFL